MHNRLLTDNDKSLLQESLSKDAYHKSTTNVDFFYAPGTISNVYEDEGGPVLVLRGTKALRLDIQFLDNRDFKRNKAVMLEGFPDLVEKAKAAGFTELIFFSNSPLLIKFCKKKLGFDESQGELRKFI